MAEQGDYEIIHFREYYPSVKDKASSTWVYNHVKYLQDHGVTNLVVSPVPYIPHFARPMFVKKHNHHTAHRTEIEDYLGTFVIRPPYLCLPKTKFLGFNLWSTTVALRSTIKKSNFRFLHAHFGHMGVSAIPLAKQFNKKLITSFYGFDLGSDRQRLLPYYQELNRVGDLFLALSEDMKKDLLACGFSEEKIRVHHLGVDLNKFAPQEKSPADPVFKFLVVCNFEERKGVQFVIQAFKEFAKDKRDVELRIIGNGGYQKELLALSEGHKQIIFRDNFAAPDPRGMVMEEMRNCDVFTLCSITLPHGEKEGTPVVLMEAQACGKPCISTYHAGIPEVVLDGKTGLLTKEKRVDEIVNAMNLLYSNSDLRKKLGQEARQYIIKEFNHHENMKKAMLLYQQLDHNFQVKDLDLQVR